MNLTLGVHGPKFVHAILFDDTPPDDDERIRPSDLFVDSEDSAEFYHSRFDDSRFDDEALFDDEAAEDNDNNENGGFDDDDER